MESHCNLLKTNQVCVGFDTSLQIGKRFQIWNELEKMEVFRLLRCATASSYSEPAAFS
jgi:hypothetical protein